MKNNVIHIDTNNKALVEQAKALLQYSGYAWPTSLSKIKPNSWIKINLDTRSVLPVSTIKSRDSGTAVTATDLASIIPQLTKEFVIPIPVPAPATPTPVKTPLQATKPVIIAKPIVPSTVTTKPISKTPVVPQKTTKPTVPATKPITQIAKPTVPVVVTTKPIPKTPVVPPLSPNTVKKFPITTPRSDHQSDGTVMHVPSN